MVQPTETTIVHPSQIEDQDWKHVLLLVLIRLGLSLAKDLMPDGSTRARLVATNSDPNAPPQPTHIEV